MRELHRTLKRPVSGQFRHGNDRNGCRHAVYIFFHNRAEKDTWCNCTRSKKHNSNRSGSVVLQESHSRLGKVVTTSAQATAKAVVRKAAAEAAQDAISRKQEETGDSAQSQVAYKDAREKEKKMGALISSLVALAHASGVAQERALFMEVASREVESQMVKLGGGMPQIRLF